MTSRWRRRDWCRALAGGVTLLSGCREAPRLWRWNGMVSGSEANFAFEPPVGAEAAALSKRCSAEVRRLEGIFSLYQEDSVLRRLNRDGVLKAPPPELLEALAICRALHQRTGGAFDVTVQPLWELFDAHFRQFPDALHGPPHHLLRQAREKVGFDAVEFDAERVRFRKPGMAITLNGLAQGYMTDRVAELLRNAGVRSALIDLGEYRALGATPEGPPWEVGIRGAGGTLLAVMALRDGALAVSSGSGWTFDPAGKHHHIFHPAGGKAQPAGETLAVTAPSAAWADGLATAGLVMDARGFDQVLANLPWPAGQRRFATVE